MIRYLKEIQRVPEIRTFDMYRIGNKIENERFEEVYKTVDEICDEFACHTISHPQLSKAI